MTQTEFGTETQRWYAGAGRSDDLTPERMAVLWDTYGRLPLNIWRNAISKALLEPRWPSAERMDALVGKCEHWEEQRVAAQRNTDAKRAMIGSGYTGILNHIRPTNAYVAACKRITIAVLEQGLTPRQTAGMLELEADATLSLHGQDVRGWHAALTQAGDDWRNYHVKARVVTPEVRVPEMGL